MNTRPLRILIAVLGLSLAATACKSKPVNPASPERNPAAVSGYVTDLPAFERFIATQPTPEQFSSMYPDVKLVLPYDIATKELRLNFSRYFAKLDDKGRIIGGQFQ